MTMTAMRTNFGVGRATQEPQTHLALAKSVALRVRVHMTNQQQLEFVQTNSDAASEIVNNLRPDRIFSAKHLAISGSEAVSILSCDSIERVDMESDQASSWPSRETQMTDIAEISVEKFERVKQAFLPEPVSVLGRMMLPPQSTNADAALLVSLRSGANMYLRVRIAPPTATFGSVPHARIQSTTAEDTRQFLAHLFSRPVIFGSATDGGIFLLNPANIVGFTLWPAPPAAVAGAWAMDLVVSG